MPRSMREWREEREAADRAAYQLRARHVLTILGAACVLGVVLAAGIMAVYSLGPNIMP